MLNGCYGASARRLAPRSRVMLSASASFRFFLVEGTDEEYHALAHWAPFLGGFSQLLADGFQDVSLYDIERNVNFLQRWGQAVKIADHFTA